MTDLQATRVGDRVELQWTAPNRTTDGLDLTFATSVEICRDDASASAKPSVLGRADQPIPCTPVVSLAGRSGQSKAVDQLAPPWTNASSFRPLVAYRVRTLNPAGRSAPPSSAAFVAAGPALRPVAGFKAHQTRVGVVLEWEKGPRDASAGLESTVEVVRSVQTPDNKAVDTPQNVSSDRKRSKKSSVGSLTRNRTGDQTADLHLRQGPRSRESDSPASDERDGMIDRSATQGMIYHYLAQRVQVVTAGGKTAEIRSDPTASTTIAMRDTFPPAAPTGLVSVPGTTMATAGHPGRTGTVDLAWEPNTETDLAGYFVYRTDLADGPSGAARPTQLNASPMPASTYRDESALPGHRYVYRVAAVDRNGNVSALSQPIEDSPEGR